MFRLRAFWRDWPTRHAVRLVFASAPGVASAMLAMLAVGSVLTLLGTVLTGLVVGAIPPALRDGIGSPAGGTVRALVIAAVAVWVADAVARSAMNPLRNTLERRVYLHTRERIMEAALGPRGLEHLEDTSYLDEIRISQGTTWIAQPERVAWGLVWVTQMRLTALGSMIILARFRWWTPAVLLLAMIVHQRWLSRETDNMWTPMVAGTGGLRRSQYYVDMSMRPDAAKEVRVFGIGPWVASRFTGQWQGAMAPVWRERRRLRGQMWRASVTISVLYGWIFVLIARSAASGEVSIGELAVYVQTALSFAFMSWESSEGDLWVKHGGRSAAHIPALDTQPPARAARLSGGRTDTAMLPQREIRFEGVRFAYPHSDHLVFDGLDMSVRAGTSLAIVGVNGAGKTTLVKLLGRLYDPLAGRILVDGIDLRDLDPDAWRARLSVIFQDFVRYELPARDNVGFGDLSLSIDEDALAKAARSAGADDVIGSLDLRWDTILSRGYPGGTDLSGGQWQKIALARALLSAQRGSGVLVLDEPTANLDVRAEAELFDRFLDLTRGITTILISHRFSSVRHAQRICVLDAGRVVEEGTHEELAALGGRYARMFSLQADRFRDEAVADDAAR